jgi:hypothetical protein
MVFKKFLSLFKKKPKSYENKPGDTNVQKIKLKPEVDVPNLNTSKMNTKHDHADQFANGQLPEFRFIEDLIRYRLNKYFPSEADISQPTFPALAEWELPLANFVLENNLTKEEAILLLIGIVPHLQPDLFDKAISSKLRNAGDFPKIGGVRGKNSRSFLPTGETVLFLLGDENLNHRLAVQQLFDADHLFSIKKILWLEELPLGEPVMSGKITMAADYIDVFLFGTSAPPHFSTSFPAKRITTKLTPGDIMMNKEVKRHYKNLKEWIKYNPPLMNEWGMDKRLRQGFRVLFYGPPGTGKTLIANVLGNETDKEVYKIDLSMVVSKYIGETEKNLELLFARAEDKNWILFFDEADAIFGKRTNVRDAHDKYANQEVSYLLQRIEDYNGLVILATNMKSNIDDAFIRRFNDLVKFTIPNEDERKEIWEKSFPENSDFDDIPDQVKKYELTGGNIINIIHFAGIQAVKRRNELLMQLKEYAYNDEYNGTEIESVDAGKLKFYLDDVIEGIKRELIKEGKPFSL